MLPSVMCVVPFCLVVALYTMAGVSGRLVPISEKVNPYKPSPCYAYVGKMRKCCSDSLYKLLGKAVLFTTAYHHSMNAIESQWVTADYTSGVLSAAGAISVCVHLLAAVAMYVSGEYLWLVISALLLVMVVSSLVAYKKIAKLGTLIFSAWRSPVTVPGNDGMVYTLPYIQEYKAFANCLSNCFHDLC